MTIHFFRKLYKSFSLSLCLATSLHAQSSHQELKACKSALMTQLNEKKRVAVKGCPVSQSLITWLGILRNPDQFTPQELITFLNSHSHWPHYEKLCLKAEDVIAKKGSQTQVLTWFKTHLPQTAEGVLAYGKALLSHKEKEKTANVVATAWHTLDLTKADESKIRTQLGQFLKEKDHVARLNFLLWNENVADAKRVLAYVSSHSRKIGEIRIALLEGKTDALQTIKALPANLRRDEGLLYEQAKWHRKHKEIQEATQILISTPSSPAHSIQWWKERNYMAREQIALTDYQMAYKILKNNGLKPGVENYADAEFLMGWLDLRFLNKPKEGQRHFEVLCANVQGAISKAKGAYWVGRALEAQNHLALAEKWYRKAAFYKTTYYGQLASSKVREKAYPTLAAAPRATPEEKARFEQKDIVKAAYILKGLGTSAQHELSKFLMHIGDKAQTRGERELSVHLAHSLSPYDVVWTARKAGYKEPVFLKKAFPTCAIPQKGQAIPEHAFAMAIVYQESRFNPTVESSANAMGLMQLISKTAAKEAERLGVKHTDQKLFDPQHNLHLGSAHLSHLLSKFNNSYLLAAAAYNAGTKPVHRWVEEFGDPHSGEVDIIDWVEGIPYGETRNYVMRVLENIANYRALKGPPKKTLVNDLS
jgi:soluble lytic murein transglycosylase